MPGRMNPIALFHNVQRKLTGSSTRTASGAPSSPTVKTRASYLVNIIPECANRGKDTYGITSRWMRMVSGRHGVTTVLTRKNAAGQQPVWRRERVKRQARTSAPCRPQDGALRGFAHATHKHSRRTHPFGCKISSVHPSRRRGEATKPAQTAGIQRKEFARGKLGGCKFGGPTRRFRRADG